MEKNEITIDEIKKHLEDEAEFIISRTDDEEIVESVERMRQSYFMYYNRLKKIEE